MKLIDGNKNKDGGKLYNKKYGHLSINDYKIMQEENKILNNKKISKNKCNLNNNDYDDNTLETEDYNNKSKLNIRNKSSKSRKSQHDKGDIKLNKKYKFGAEKIKKGSNINSIAKELENLDIFKGRRAVTSNDEQMTKVNHSSYIQGIDSFKNKLKNITSIVKLNTLNNSSNEYNQNLQYINNFNKNVFKNQYWGDPKAVEMLQRNKDSYNSHNSPLKLRKPQFLKEGLNNLNSLKPIKESLAGKKLPNLSLRERNKTTIMSSDTIPFVL